MIPLKSDPGSHFPPGPPARTLQPSEDLDLGEWLANFWEGRYLILGSFLLFLGLGVFYVWRSVPVYQIEAMLQVQARKERTSDPAFTKMQGLFSEPGDAQAEIEILKSNLVLGRTVETLNLDTAARPILLPVVGAALMRRDPAAPAIAIQSFEVPPDLRVLKFRITALGDGSFQWATGAGEALGTGRPGDLLRATWLGRPLELRVRSLTGKPGQKFELARKPMQVAIAELRRDFTATEKGKDTSVIGLTYKSPNQAQGVAVLNEIVHQYVRHKLDKKGGEAAQTLAILQEKLPLLKAKLDESETRLNQFRSHSGSVDLTKEAEEVVTQATTVNSTISTLQQKREELLRTYQPTADVVTTVNEQIRKLQSEGYHLEAKARALPVTQQTVVRLSRDVAVNQELYTALLNNIQELQFSKGSDVGSFDLVDPAQPGMEPMGPKPDMQIGMFGFLGLLVGGGTARLKRLLRKGVKDHRLIEAKLGLPVVVTIPHSAAQEKLATAIARRREGLHLLALAEPEDLAMESLRSLRTVLHFSMTSSPDHVIMLTGPAPAIGKSFISSNFATLMAVSGRKVLLVDGDLRKGNLHQYFGMKERQTGLTDVLAQRATWEAAIHRTKIPGLDLITTGPLPPNPSELLMSAAFQKFLGTAAAAYSCVIIDAPPLLAVTDAAIIGTHAGTVLLVAKFGQHPIDELRTCQQRLENAGVRLVGCVFNDIQTTGLGYLGSDYQYAYHYKYKA
ncbi:MAG: polysaccharide biosynthesis tyrosine autokinase [Holophaga sp.]|nr:polysaccharide biosynthesis tyrosine autokinase [Holophaga sp.]